MTDSIETMLSAITAGRPNTILISFNDHWYYPDQEIPSDHLNWISPSERRLAEQQNTVWTVRYFAGEADGPGDAQSFSASTLQAVLAVVQRYLEVTTEPKAKPVRAKPTRVKTRAKPRARPAAAEPPAVSNVLPFIRPVQRK